MVKLEVGGDIAPLTLRQILISVLAYLSQSHGIIHNTSDKHKTEDVKEIYIIGSFLTNNTYQLSPINYVP